jgi:CrcB protein
VSFAAVIAVGGGAAVGAWLRWALGIALNPLLPMLPLGTLAANLGGGFMMGIAMEIAARNAALSPEMRLLTMTGFLGGLTTFSTFSGEVTALLLRRDLWWAAMAIAAHVVGSVVLTIAGIALARVILVR